MRVYNIDKAKAIVLYILQNIEDADLLRIFKILYFAEKKHLANYGNMILSDTYVAMKHGPVPMELYELFKAVRGDINKTEESELFYNAFEIKERFKVFAKENANLDYLTRSNITCIDDAIAENKDLDFKALSEKSHDAAWNSAALDDTINIDEIGRAGGANEEMMKYIDELVESENLLLEH